MKTLVETICAMLVITILLPYVATVLFQGNGVQMDMHEDHESSRWIICGESKPEREELEEYVIGAVAASVPVTYEPEALKAQAIVIRTHILLLMKEKETISEQELKIDYMDIAAMQATWGYQSFAENYEKLRKAVEETRHQVLFYKGELIYPPFHAVSAGRTRNGNAVAGKQVYPYLQSVDSSMDLESEDYLKIEYYNHADFISRLRQLNEKIVMNQMDEKSKPELVRDEDSEYVKELWFHEDDIHISGEQFRELFHLNSTCFYIEEFEENIRIVTKGLGHGIGLSLFGANQMAKQGSSCETILQYYFSGINIHSFGE